MLFSKVFWNLTLGRTISAGQIYLNRWQMIIIMKQLLSDRCVRWMSGWAILEDFIAIPILGGQIGGNLSNPKPLRIVLERID